MPNPLYNVPFYGGYLARRDQQAQEQLGDIQKAGVLFDLKNKVEAQRAAQAQERAVQEAGGNLEKMVEALLRTGNREGADRVSQIIERRRKAKIPISATAGTQQLDPNDPSNVLHTTPFKPETPKPFEDIKNVPGGYLSRGPDGKIKFTKTSEGMTINMPQSSDTVQGPDGKFYKLRIGKDGKAEAIPFQTASGDPLRPPESASDVKERLEKARATDDVAEIERLGVELDALIKNNQGLFVGVVGPQGYIGRILDLAGGMAGADTPALDFGNKSKLFLSSVSKLIKADTQLSDKDKQDLLQSIGEGFWQTGASSIRARNDVMHYVRTKRLGGLKKPPTHLQEDLEFTARKHGITVEEVLKRLGR